MYDKHTILQALWIWKKFITLPKTNSKSSEHIFFTDFGNIGRNFQASFFSEDPWDWVYLPTYLADLYGFHVGKYTVRPMDPLGFWSIFSDPFAAFHPCTVNGLSSFTTTRRPMWKSPMKPWWLLYKPCLLCWEKLASTNWALIPGV